MSPGIGNFDRSPKTTPHGVVESNSRSEPPKRLRHWLIDMINSGEIPGLQWENNAHTIFRIPWKHAGKNNWKEEDCKIFQAWAEHRGKYKTGDKIDAATWKTRLRCALNKLSDIKELKERSYLEGNEPYRVYQLLPEPDKNQDCEIYPRNTWSKESPTSYYNSSPKQFHHSPGYPDRSGYVVPPYHHQQSHHRQDTRVSPIMPSSPHDMLPGMSHSLLHTPPMIPTSEFRKLKVNEANAQAQQQLGYTVNKIDVVPPECVDMGPSVSQIKRNPSCEVYEAYSPSDGYPQPAGLMPQQNVMSSAGSSPTNNGQFMDMDYNGGAPMMDMMPGEGVVTELPFPDVPPQTHEMEIYVRYRGVPVISEHVDNKSGCRVHYGDASLQLIAMATHQLPSGVFGPDCLRQIELVDCEPYAQSTKQVTLTQHVLNNIKRGLLIQFEDGCFYATRLCQSRVFITGPETTSSTPERLERNNRVKVFDYKKFWATLHRFVGDDRAKSPEFELEVSFGQNWSIKTPINKNLVTLSMVPRAARYLVQKAREQQSRFGSINDSLTSDCGPDSYDRLAELATNQSSKGLTDFVEQMVNENPSFLSMVKPLSEPTAPGSPAMSQAQQSGCFQQNAFLPALVPPPSTYNDIEMTGYHNQLAYSREARR